MIEFNKETIFISIASYNEMYVKTTVDSALAKAKYPERISFGISEHRSDNIFIDFSNYQNIKHIKIYYEAALGLGFSRPMPMVLYDNEDFILQIDAHTFFNNDWDIKLIEGYHNIYKDLKNENIIITDRPVWWTLNKDNSFYFLPPQENTISILSYESNSQPIEILDNGGYPKISGIIKPIKENENYKEHFLFSAHYAFSKPNFFQDIMLDPWVQFEGDEATIALRASTRGYRFFNITEHILWHFNKHNIESNPLERWKKPGKPELEEHHDKKTQPSLERVRKILTGEILGHWGAPNKELLEVYEKNLNFSYKDFYKKLGF